MESDLQNEPRTIIDSEKLAYWYLRLNGFMTIINFVVHPESGREQRTDVDILGCRFPYRRELYDMIDEELFTEINDKVFIVLAEVKRKTCALNGPWTKPERENMQRVLRAIGAFRDNVVDHIAACLYQDGFYENQTTRISLMCFGKQINKEINERYNKEVPQVIWPKVVEFVYNRFRSFSEQKSAHSQWDIEGGLLWDLTMKSNNCIDLYNKLDIR